MTLEAMELHGKLEPLLRNSWPLDTIPDAILMAVFLNPACASHNMLDCAESSGKKLRDKAKELAVKELTLIIAEERKKAARQQRESRLDTKEPGHSSDFTNDFFELQASYQVAAYSMRVTKQPTLYTKHKEALQDFWKNWGNYQNRGNWHN